MADQITLNPDSEFEAQLIDMVKMHRAKSGRYAQDSTDPLNNFTNASNITGFDPWTCSELFSAKHQSVIRDFLQNGGEYDQYLEDAMLDRAVYAVISRALYLREKAAAQP